MKKLDKIVIGSGNPAKVERFGRLLSKYASEVVGVKDLGIEERPKESGETAEENAEIKAKFYHARTKLPVLTEDESLFCDFLPKSKQPGVNVRRVNGRDEVDDDTLLNNWEKVVEKVPEKKRTGYWHIAYCLCDGKESINTVAVDAPIIFFSPSSKIRLTGWPMSSLEGPSELAKPHSELTNRERKMHNQKADRKIAKILNKLFS